MAVSIPIFTSQLEKARDAVTLANLRSAYALAQTEYLTSNGNDHETTENNQTVKYDSTTKKVTVTNVVSKGNADGLSGTDELPFTVDETITGKNGMGGTAAANWTVTFTYAVDAGGNVTGVSAAAEAGKK